MSTDYNNNWFSTFIVLLRPEGFSVIIKYLITCPLNTPVMNIVAKFLVQGNNRSLCLSWNSLLSFTLRVRRTNYSVMQPLKACRHYSAIDNVQLTFFGYEICEDS